MSLRPLLVLFSLGLLSVGCSGTDDASIAQRPAPSSTPTSPPPGDNTTTETSPTQPAPSGSTPVTPPLAGGTLGGTVSRTAAVPLGQDGIGDLYIGVFDKNPIVDQSAKPIGNQLVKGANLAAAGSKVPYSVTGLPTSAATVFVVAFLDDDGNASVDQKPHKPDLVTLDGISPVKVTLSASGTSTKDLVLNAEMPF